MPPFIYTKLEDEIAADIELLAQWRAYHAILQRHAKARAPLPSLLSFLLLSWASLMRNDAP